jgi:hypothetical protein
MKNTGKIFTIGALMFLLFFPALGFVHGQDTNTPTDYTVLAPLPGTTKNCDQSQTSASDNCATDLQTYLPGAFNLIVGLAAVLAFLVLTYGGVFYMTSDAISGKSQGKEYITNALLGLGLVLASWLILFTIGGQKMLQINLQLVQPNMTQSTLNLSALSSLDASAVAAASASTPGLHASGPDLLSGNTLTTDQDERIILTNDGIGVNNPPCSTTLTNNCTDVNLLTPTLVTNLSNVASSCATSNGGTPCSVIITGGNEATLHNTDTTHSTGDTVDLAPTTSLNSYLGDPSPQNNDKKVVNGVTFTYEANGANPANTGNHWHATICTGTTAASCP